MINIKNRQLYIGDRIRCKNWKELRQVALTLSSEGYGVAVLGFGDMSDDILTITALPEGSKANE